VTARATFAAASAAALLALVAAAQAQVSGPATRPAATTTATTRPTTMPATAPSGPPKVGDVVSLIDRATAPEAGKTPGEWSAPIKMAVVFAALALLPSLLVMMTSFTRIVIVLAFVRRALTTQNIPPTVAIIGLALFLTLFTMSPTFALMDRDAIQPYLAGQVPFGEACSTTMDHLKDFMIRQTRAADLSLFAEMASLPLPDKPGDVPMHVAVPAFAMSEFRTAFEMGCLLFIPFLLVDLVISSILLSAGMMMLPPAIVSLPFKIILFVLVDGWQLLARTLVTSFH
jgi:flagellar biosynthetic protein FliP